jgi:AcrR family transcriptional regulator
MAQVLKPAVRASIEQAALRCFAASGYAGTSVAQVASAAGTAPGNVYRYFASKEALFDAVVPATLAARHDALLDTRVAALTDGRTDGSSAELLDFWLGHRPQVVVLLDRAEGTPLAHYPASFVDRLVGHVERTLPAPLSAVQREVLEIVFDNTRRAIARILAGPGDRERSAALVTAFWSYQLPGLNGLRVHLAGRPEEHSRSPENSEEGVR